MKKLIVLFVVLTIAMISVLPSFAEDEKAFHLISTANDGLGDKIDYPWMNMQMLGGLTWRTLFFVEPDMATIGPDLASGYEVSDDGLTYTIDFIGGAKWSDGEEITLNDVVFSIKANLKAAASNGIYTSAFTKIEGADTWREGAADDLAGLSVDGNKLTIKLTRNHGYIVPVLAGQKTLGIGFSLLHQRCGDAAEKSRRHIVRMSFRLCG